MVAFNSGMHMKYKVGGIMKNKIIAIQTIILMVLLFTTFSLKNDIKTLRQNQENYNYQVQNMGSNISRINSLLYEKNEKEKFIQFQDFAVDNIDEKYEKANINATIRFNEIKNDAVVYLQHRAVYPNNSEMYIYNWGEREMPLEEQFGEWKEVGLIKTNAAEYNCEFQADYQSDYETRVVIEADGITKSEETNRIDLYSTSIPRYDLDIRPHEISSEGYMKYEITLSQIEYDSPIKIVSANCEVYNNKTKIEDYNLMELQNLKNKMQEVYIWSVTKKVDINVGKDGEIDPGLRIEVTISDELGKEYKTIWKSMR